VIEDGMRMLHLLSISTLHHHCCEILGPAL
jgi:hypothetical protein